MARMKWAGAGHEAEASEETVTFAAGLQVPKWIAFTARRFLGYDVRVRAELQDRRFVCTEVTVTQRSGGPAVTGDALRDVRVHEIVRAALRLAVVKEGRDDEGWRTFGDLGAQLRAPDGLARKGPTDETLRWVAQAYEVAYALNDPPTKSVQMALGVSRATAGRWVAEARRRGMLPPADGEDS